MQLLNPENQFLLLLALLLPAALMDLSRHRIPNYLTYPALLAGLGWGFASGAWAGLGNHLLGALAAALPLFLMFMGGSLGGGDVKLMAAVGAIVGFPSAINALIASIMVGGLCAALILIWQGRLWGLVRYSWANMCHRAGLLAEPPQAPPEKRDAFPFGLAIAIGSCLVCAPPQLFISS
jgi:prepilin peptidase CpaA